MFFFSGTSTFSNVFGFLPTLLFLCLKINVPNLAILTFFLFISSSKIKDNKSSSKFSETFFENPRNL